MDKAMPIIFLGLSTSGKTALIRSAINNQNEIFPTAGIEIYYITNTSKQLLVYDCSGQGSSRGNWSLLAQPTECVVYVIDSHNPESFSVAKKHLMLFLQKNKYMKNKNLCIMLNKCDLKTRPPKEVLIKALQTPKISKLVNKFYIKETSAYNKQGIQECLQWIIKNSTEINE